ncbi:MAG: hypothetical protein GC186_00080 [Rhodobacteraceae bacterium]|nr:hypothetical protein [Paracoccaceae bacterium]
MQQHMLKIRVLGLALGTGLIASTSGWAGSSTSAPSACARASAASIPARSAKAPGGTAVMAGVEGLRGKERDAVLERQLLAGNIPPFLRDLVPVNFSGQFGGKTVRITICVMPDYLSVGTNRDFVRTPLGLPTAAQVALRLGFLLPTPKMVDAIYAQARIRLSPQPMPAGDEMTSTGYLMRHNETVDAQLGSAAGTPDELIAGQKKDVVMTNRLREFPGKVAIYGWHRGAGDPIQPLSTVHQAVYADYSHGIRLVSAIALVNGQLEPLAEVMQDPTLSTLISREGPIEDAEGLMATVSQ